MVRVARSPRDLSAAMSAPQRTRVARSHGSVFHTCAVGCITPPCRYTIASASSGGSPSRVRIVATSWIIAVVGCVLHGRVRSRSISTHHNTTPSCRVTALAQWSLSRTLLLIPTIHIRVQTASQSLWRNQIPRVVHTLHQTTSVSRDSGASSRCPGRGDRDVRLGDVLRDVHACLLGWFRVPLWCCFGRHRVSHLGYADAHIRHLNAPDREPLPAPAHEPDPCDQRPTPMLATPIFAVARALILSCYTSTQQGGAMAHQNGHQPPPPPPGSIRASSAASRPAASWFARSHSAHGSASCA